MIRLFTAAILLGAAPALLAQDGVFYQEVSWSPDGEWLGFTEVDTQEPFGANILLMRPNGKGVRALPHGQRSARWTAWHPDGTKLAFAGETATSWEIFVIDLETEAVTQLTDTPEDEAAPSWSPDGSALVFSARVGGLSQVFRIDADGSGLTNLSNNDEDDRHPVWSPSGERIVFYTAYGTIADHLYVMRPDGTDRRQVTSGHVRDMFAAWAPDGSHVVFTRQQTGTTGLYQMDPAGSVPLEIVSPAFFGRLSPDGTRVAFIRGEWPKSAIYVGKTGDREYKHKRIRH